jgi:hypothetical protein
MQKLKAEGLFSKFVAIWGQKWLKPLEDDRARNDAINVWGNMLSELDDEQIVFAIDKCSRMCEFPPSISEFIAAAWDIPSFAVVKNGGNDSLFYHILITHRLTAKTGMMTPKEVENYYKENYEALREEFLLGTCKEVSQYVEKK